MNDDNDIPSVDGEVVEEALVAVGSTALEALTRGEIDVQIATAHRFPRSLKRFRERVVTMATVDEDTAARMFYRLPRDGKQIEGPSIRFAEIAATAYGNCRYGSRVIEVGDRTLRAQGFCHDLETNIAVTVEVSRRITNKSGRRFNDDMIQTTAQAAQAIAQRNAILKVVPLALLKDALQKSKDVAIGKALTMEQRRTRAFEWYAKVGVTQAEVLALLGRVGADDVDTDDLFTLLGWKTALQEGALKMEELVRPVRQTAPPTGASTAEALHAAINTAQPATGVDNAKAEVPAQQPAPAAAPPDLSAAAAALPTDPAKLFEKKEAKKK